jgi:hypothetical protein
VIEHADQRVVYLTPNTRALWRVETLFSKEPDTIEWIASFAPDEVLADIGANVGMYTIWAAKTRGTRVFAFEPEAQNYALLNCNIHANGLDQAVRAYCSARGRSGAKGCFRRSPDARQQVRLGSLISSPCDSPPPT